MTSREGTRSPTSTLAELLRGAGRAETISGSEDAAPRRSAMSAAGGAWPYPRRMTIQRMDHVGVVVDDLEAAIAFFVELGMELEGKSSVEGRWVDSVVGLDDVRVDVAFVRTPDGHSRLELTKFQNPVATTAEPNAPANTLGLRRIMFAVDDIDDVVAPPARSWLRTRRRCGAVRGQRIGSATSAAPRASSLRWPRSSAEVFRLDAVRESSNRPWSWSGLQPGPLGWVRS